MLKLSIFILFVISPIIGCILVLKEKHLNATVKVLWLFAVLIFNFIGLICFLVWQKSNAIEQK